MQAHRKRRKSLLVGSLSALLAGPQLACSPAGDTEEAAAPTHSSVLLVSIDTLRADHVGFHGYARDTTPFLDRLSEESLVFDHAMSPAPWTLTSHVTMLTGLYPYQHGVVDPDLALNEGIAQLPERLQAAGYQTVGLYYPGWIKPAHGFGRGFDVFRSHQNAEEAGAHLLDALAALDRSRPFFLFLHLFDVHSDALRPGENLLYRSPPELRELFLEGVADLIPEASAKAQWNGVYKLGKSELEAVIACYDGGIRAVDAYLEEWFGEMQRSGWLKNTMIVVTSDHGEALGQRERLRGHGDFFQEGLHVPLLVRHPRGMRAGERVSTPVHLADILPTILDGVGLPEDPLLPGVSMLGPIPADRILTGARGPDFEEYFLRWPLKARRYANGFSRLIDLENDPGELNTDPLGKLDYESWRTEFLEQFPARIEFPAAVPVGPVADSITEDLEALGY